MSQLTNDCLLQNIEIKVFLIKAEIIIFTADRMELSLVFPKKRKFCKIAVFLSRKTG